jgi:broad specificity phosphatase PhoE
VSGVRRLVLLRHARTAAVRAGAFPVLDEPLDERGTADARAGAAVVAAAGWARDGVLCSPLVRARQTVSHLGVGPGAIAVDALAEADFGRWSGRSLADVTSGAPDDVTAWMTSPHAAPHGGESLADVVARVGVWLDAQALAAPGRVLAVTHGGVVKAALVHALGAPLEAFWRLDVAPLGATELHAHDGRWTVAGVNVPLLERTTPMAEDAVPAPAPAAAATPAPGRRTRALGAVWGGS